MVPDLQCYWLQGEGFSSGPCSGSGPGAAEPWAAVLWALLSPRAAPCAGSATGSEETQLCASHPNFTLFVLKDAFCSLMQGFLTIKPNLQSALITSQIFTETSVIWFYWWFLWFKKIIFFCKSNYPDFCLDLTPPTNRKSVGVLKFPLCGAQAFGQSCPVPVKGH